MRDSTIGNIVYNQIIEENSLDQIIVKTDESLSNTLPRQQIMKSFSKEVY